MKKDEWVETKGNQADRDLKQRAIVLRGYNLQGSATA
jgi:hypothetical protein